MKKRCSGILMPVSSLPGGYGIGSMGQAARDFVDFLVLAGQSVWQILPVGPTSYGDSPYQSCSAFAGNPYFIDLDQLAADGLLKPEDYAKENWGTNPNYCDYACCTKSATRCCARHTPHFCSSARCRGTIPPTAMTGTVLPF